MEFEVLSNSLSLDFRVQAETLRRGIQDPPVRLDSRAKEKKAVSVLKEGRSQMVTEHQAGGVTGRRGRD